MCGVFGFVAKGDRGPDLKRLEAMAAATEARGRHAFGFAWADPDGGIWYFKQAGKITDHLGLLAMAKDARVLVGHCRWATHGSPDDNANNHPHLAAGGCYVHNGVIRGHDRIARTHRLRLETQCDSEVIGRLVEASAGPMLGRLRTASRVCLGGEYRGGYNARLAGLSCGAGYVVLGLWDDGDGPELYGVRAGNPLQIGTAARGTYLASLPDGLPKDRAPVLDGACFRLSRTQTETRHV